MRAGALTGFLSSPFLRGLALYFVLPNLAFFLVGREIFINRPLINSDYLVLWIASCYLSPGATSVLLAGLLCLDAVLSTESIYHFSTVETIHAALDLFEFAPGLFYAAAAALLLLALAALAVAGRLGAVRTHLSTRGRVLVGVTALGLSGAPVAQSFQSADSSLATPFGDSALVGSGIVETGRSSFALAVAVHRGQQTFLVAAEATSDVARDFTNRAPSTAAYHVLLVLVESEGLLKNKGDMRKVLAPLIDPAIKAKYDVRSGTVPFFGQTMFGELRTLCRVYMPQARPDELLRADLCLPNLLRGRGYETISYHGYHSGFYERESWYPKLGFQRSYFLDELMPIAPPSARCGTVFAGLCDLWIADRVEHELATAGTRRKFVYWLTLNSHLPVDSALASQSSFDCAATESLRDETGPCELARIHYQLHTRIARMALSPGLAPTRFIVVGDHDPPFPVLSERALYDGKQVPFVELVPRISPPAHS